MTKLILYTRPACPFSARVLLEAAVLGVDLEERSISNPEHLKELEERGGKVQSPFLWGEGVALYESDDIMTFLHDAFGK